ncbi:hypothetical protein INR49_007392 [Caranx melampygus]|nr:hypothetical protein INR49_007392 [Caranx melampygus]
MPMSGAAAHGTARGHLFKQVCGGRSSPGGARALDEARADLTECVIPAVPLRMMDPGACC